MPNYFILDYSITFLTKCDWKKLLNQEYTFQLRGLESLKLPAGMSRQECLDILQKLDNGEVLIDSASENTL